MSALDISGLIEPSGKGLELLKEAYNWWVEHDYSGTYWEDAKSHDNATNRYIVIKRTGVKTYSFHGHGSYSYGNKTFITKSLFGKIEFELFEHNVIGTGVYFWDNQLEGGEKRNEAVREIGDLVIQISQDGVILEFTFWDKYGVNNEKGSSYSPIYKKQ